MWRRAAKLASLRRFKISPQSSLTSPCSHLNLRLHRWPSSVDDAAYFLLNAYPMGSQVSLSGSPSGALGYSGSDRYYGSAAAAEAIVSTSSEDDEEVRELVQEIKKLEKKNSAASLKQSEPAKDFGGMSPWKYNALRRRQQKVETEAWLQAAKEYQELLADMCEQKLAPNLPYMKSLFLGWFEPLRDAIQAEQDMCRQKSSRAAHGPYFVQLPADKMAVITMNKIMALLMSGDGHGHAHAKVVVAALQIGEAVENEVKIQSFFEKPLKKSSASDEPDEGSLEEKKAQDRLRKKVTTLIKQQKVHIVRKIVKGHQDVKPWGQENQAKVGACLIQLLTETAFILPPSDHLGDAPPDVRPAFIHTMQTFSDNSQKRTRNYGVIECDPLVRKGLEKTAKHMVIPYMPMLVPPEKWKGYDKGAYLFLNSFAMRTHGAREQRQAMKRTPFQQLEQVFLALDTLGSTKWKVNKRVLNIIDRIWAAGGRVADLVDREDNPLPEEPATDNEDEKKKWKWKVKAIKKENNERHSQRCDTELKLAVARKMQDEGFYYPHNVDFRGRAYPIHPHLNHLGSDLCRGILEFADGKPLGKTGLRWLKIHLANLYARGVDKLSYDGRIAFAENHMNDIFDSADRPLEGKRWWLEAEDPFQCLAVCINLTEALRSSCPEAYVSHVPVHQDGSCNGLQHYAALGRDKLGAAAVNLMAGDKPADVYSDIAARVRDIMGKVAQKDPAVDPNVLHARALVNQIDRKLVKQTVMTSVYGVTFIGARDQIKKRLKERFPQEDDDIIFGWSCYAAKTTLFALEEKFEAATSIMSWLGDCAKIIASENHPVSWTTPLGLPVVQPYRHKGRHLIKTSLQVLTLQRDTDKVKAKRQKSAFPPNFVHSLDGSHMMMTAIACKNAGLSFAGVHDSYWTHAADVDQMNKILREKFVELYELPILESLLKSFQQSFPQLDFPPLPDRGDFDLREVLQSPYFFN